MKPIAISALQLSRLMGVSRMHVYRMMNDGRLAEARLGGRRLVPVEEVERILGKKFRPEWLEKAS